MKAFLDSFAGQEFIRLLEDKAKPRRVPEVRPGMHPDTVVSQHYHHLHGLQKAADFARALATDYDEKTIGADDDADDAFFHSLAPEMKDAIKKGRTQST